MCVCGGGTSPTVVGPPVLQPGLDRAAGRDISGGRTQARDGLSVGLSLLIPFSPPSSVDSLAVIPPKSAPLSSSTPSAA